MKGLETLYATSHWDWTVDIHTGAISIRPHYEPRPLSAPGKTRVPRGWYSMTPSAARQLAQILESALEKSDRVLCSHRTDPRH